MRDQCLEDTRTETPDLTFDWLERRHPEVAEAIDRSWADSDLTRDMLIDHVEDKNFQERALASRMLYRKFELHRLWTEGKYHRELMEAGQ